MIDNSVISDLCMVYIAPTNYNQIVTENSRNIVWNISQDEFCESLSQDIYGTFGSGNITIQKLYFMLLLRMKIQYASIITVSTFSDIVKIYRLWESSDSPDISWITFDLDINDITTFSHSDDLAWNDMYHSYLRYLTQSTFSITCKTYTESLHEEYDKDSDNSFSMF